jgi:K(+)-stimulated pyrophosphate-energized sodium pump
MSGFVVAADTAEITLSSTNTTYVVIVAVIALLALAMSYTFRRQVLAAGDGTPRMQEIAQGVEGAAAYLNRQFRTLGVFVVLVFALLFLLPRRPGRRIGRSVFFVVGAVFSGDRLPRHVAGGARPTSGWRGGPTRTATRR